MKILSTIKLAEAVNYYRIDNGLTIEDFSNLTGLNVHNIHRIESGKYIPTIEQFETLSKHLNLDLNLLLEDDKQQNTFDMLRKEVCNQSERDGLEALFSMMATLKQQVRLRRAFEDSLHN
jgi:transcriptional regulator with XRE-family HTH domain